MATAFARLAAIARTMAATASYRAAVELVALRWGVKVGDLQQRSQRHSGFAELRRQALYLAVIGGHSRRQIAKVSGLSPEAVARACRSIEEARDDPELDRALDELELETR